MASMNFEQEVCAAAKPVEAHDRRALACLLDVDAAPRERDLAAHPQTRDVSFGSWELELGR